MFSDDSKVAVAARAGGRRARFTALLENLLGTPRRFFLTHFRSAAVARSLALRRGECNRCGVCCQLVVTCVHLRWENGLAACAIYGKHPPNCSRFPINPADLADVNRIAPHKPCNFFFVPPPRQAPRSA